MTRSPAPDGLLELADDLVRAATRVRAEVATGDAPMARGFSIGLVHAARLVETGVRSWSDSVPAQVEPENPYGPVTLVGSTTVDALGALTDGELFDYYRQLEWSYVHETRPGPRAWLDRARRQARDAVRERPGLPDV